MSIVTLVSGGLDSTLMAVLSKESNLSIYPLFVNYGQRAYEKEYGMCKVQFEKLRLPEPVVANIAGLGELIPCGLTNSNYNIYKEAFLPGRNLYFLMLAASYAYTLGIDSVAIGLLSEEYSIFPDQKKSFIIEAEKMIRNTIGIDLSILTPLMSFGKSDVVALAREKGIYDYYSCHAGTDEPCGKCIACKEYDFLKEI